MPENRRLKSIALRTQNQHPENLFPQRTRTAAAGRVVRLIKTPLFLLSLSYVFCRKRYPAICDFLEKFPAPSAPYLHRVCTCEFEEDGTLSFTTMGQAAQATRP